MVDQVEWELARAALRRTGDRFAELLTSAPSSAAAATRDWSVADTAAHVAAIASLNTHLIQPETVRDPLPGIQEVLAVTTVDTVADLNELVLARYPERDPQRLAERLRADIDQVLRATGPDPDRTVDWLGGSRVPVAGLVAHLLNELLIHGRDLARGIGTRWNIPRPEAARFFDLFLVPLVRCGYGRLLDTDQPAPRRRIEVEFRSRHTSPFTLVLERGVVSAAASGRPDVRVRFDPAVLALTLFGRISKPRAALTGGLLVSGPRPWLLPGFLRIVRLPS